MKWTRDRGKPYIRRANGKERAESMADAYRLAAFQMMYGKRGFYVMVQRDVGRPVTVMAVEKTRVEIVSRLVGLRIGRGKFNAWANRVKRMAQG